MYKGDFLSTLQAAISTTITVFDYSYFEHNANDTYLQDIFLFLANKYISTLCIYRTLNPTRDVFKSRLCTKNAVI